MKLLHLLFLTGLACSVYAQTNYNQTTVTVLPDDGITPMTVTQNLAGICAVVRKIQETGKIIIVETLKNGASDKAGLLANDEIVQINSTKTEGMDLKAAVDLLRGDPGTIVKLTIRREAVTAPILVDVTRELVRLPNAK